MVTGLAGCSSSDVGDPRSAAPATTSSTSSSSAVPVIDTTPMWSRNSNMWGPGVTSGHFWAVSLDHPSGPGPRGTTVTLGLRTGDATTGRTRALPMPGGRAICSLAPAEPDSSGAGRFLVGTLRRSGCEVALLTVTAGGSGWGPPEDVVSTAPEMRANMTQTVIGTWDDVTVVSSYDAVWGEDATGATVWTGPVLRHRDGPPVIFDWTEKVVPSPAGPLLVTYDFAGTDQITTEGAQPDATLTLLDPATGQAARDLGSVRGSNFRWLVDDVAIFARMDGYASVYDGHRLPEA